MQGIFLWGGVNPKYKTPPGVGRGGFLFEAASFETLSFEAASFDDLSFQAASFESFSFEARFVLLQRSTTTIS